MTRAVILTILSIALSLLAASSGSVTAFGQCELAKLIAPDRTADDYFGNPIAVSGDYAVVGSVRSDGVESETGAAYLFRRAGADWVYDSKLTASDGEFFDFFGIGVAIDGDVVGVGAYLKDSSASDAGAVHVYRRLGSAWAEEVELAASDADPGDEFGISVALSGQVLVVGAPGDDETGIDAGAVYVYRYDGLAWLEEAKLAASDAEDDDRLGWTVVVDGDVILASAVRDDDGGSQTGSAYVFRHVSGAWVEEAKLTASDGLPGDWFSFSLWVDGDVAVFGAHFAAFGTGKAYVFRRVGGAWVQAAILTASDAAIGDHFGLAVAIDGDKILVGARRDDDSGTDSGSAYVFQRAGLVWVETTKILASDGADFDHFGRSVALAGGLALIGAYQDDSNAGAAYVFWIDDAAPDCDADLVPDPCAIIGGTAFDCNVNGAPDACDIASGASMDGDLSGIPDECEGPRFIRGDVDGGGSLLINDAILILAYLFSAGAVPCLDACDWDDDGQALINDAILHLGYLFSMGAPPAAPYPACGVDLTADAAIIDLGCVGMSIACP